jgi:hypothetical protein
MLAALTQLYLGLRLPAQYALQAAEADLQPPEDRGLDHAEFWRICPENRITGTGHQNE